MFDGLKTLLAIIIMTVMNFFFPVLSIIILAVWPIPVVLMAVKHGMKVAGITIIVAAIINGFLFGPLMGLITIIGFGFVGFIIGGSLNEGLSPARTLLFTIIGVITSQLLIVAISHYIFGFDMKNLVEQIIKQLSEAGDTTFKEIIQAQFHVIKAVFPAIIVISSILTGILNYYLSLWYLNNRGISKKIFLPVKLWRFPRWYISFGIIVSLIFKTNTFFVNLNIVLLFLTFLQGFAVGLFYIEKTKKPVFFRWLYIFTILFIPPVPIILMLTGLIDMWFNLRKLG